MANLWIGNIDDGTTDDEIRELLIRYGLPPFDTIQRIEGTGARPAVLLEFIGVDHHALRSLQPRLHNLFWKNRVLTVQVMPERDET
ncbi:RNA recognition motif-containing protein [Paraburkholderia sp. GAS448]|uniref:RNA recognition motif domain-containing protein n=1 Tax=Paraburkholderia sp. GAS448 TaxID=3035136 RepID=UPI003D1B64C0